MADSRAQTTTKGIICKEIFEEEEEDPEEDPEEEAEKQLEEEQKPEEEEDDDDNEEEDHDDNEQDEEEEEEDEEECDSSEEDEDEDDDDDEEEEEEEGEDGEEEEEEEENGIPESNKEEKNKQKELEVFVGGLHRDATENDVKMVFQKVGEVIEVRLVKDPYSNRNKGFAFVRFATVDQAKKATIELKQTVVKGKSCGVMKNKASVTLHVGNICTSWTKVDLVEKLKTFDLENLEDIQLIDDPHIRGKNRGYAFLDFRTHMDAVVACANLRRSNIFFGTDVRADISISKTIEPDEEVMAQVKSVFLDGLPVHWNEAQLQEHLRRFGKIESIRLACNMPTAKRKDFGFICFTTREAALDCIEKVNKDGIGEGDNKVLVKATLKKPLQKREPPTLGVRGGYIRKGFGTRGKQSYRSARSSMGRPDRFKSPGQFPSRCRESDFKAPMPTRSMRLQPRLWRGLSSEIPAPMPTRSTRLQPRSWRGHSSEIPGPAVPKSRSRDSYRKNSSSNQRTPGRHSTTYSQLRRPYSVKYDDDNHYDPWVEHCEAYEYDDLPERSYYEMDHDMMISNSQPRHGRSRYGVEMNAYQEYDYRSYNEYSRFSLDERMECERVEHPRHYFTRRDAPRNY